MDAGTQADDTGIVEFKATYFLQRDLHVLHERSRFVREDGRWYYLDAVDTVL
jgi:SEC-C motif domain protein